MIGFFLRHYCTFADKIIIYDGGSTDGTREEITTCPSAEIHDWPGSDALCDDEFLEFANSEGQWSDADWNILVDADELVYHPSIRDVLGWYLREGVEVPRIQGFTMVSKSFPTTQGQIYEEVRCGFPDVIWSKPAVFRNRMCWTMGRHGLDFTRFQRPVQSATAEIKLLHYRALGIDYVRERHKRNWDRVPERCRRMNLGTNTSPDFKGPYSVEWFAEQIEKPWPEVV
jgi:hypothetical protein